MTVPIATSPGRSGFGPQLALSYDSGSGNGPFGFGWSLALPSITRKTDKGLPKYLDNEESDVFLLSGAEDLVPTLNNTSAGWQRYAAVRTVGGVEYRIHRYRPRTEGLFASIERWTNLQSGEVHWRSITQDNVTTLYGRDNNSRIFDPKHPTRVFSWLICESYDDKGNAIVYEYKEENSDGVLLLQAHEKNRTAATRSVNRYLKRVRYGNRVSRLVQPDLSAVDWMFEAVLDYGEHDLDAPSSVDAGEWFCRHDPFSTWRAGFEVRTYRLCQRVLMFHHFPTEENVGEDCLVRSTDFVYRDIRDDPDDLRKGHPVASFIASVTQRGYRREAAGYVQKSLPPIEFTYSQVEVQEEVQEVDTEDLENLPSGLDGEAYRWVDLDGEGVSGVLTEQAEAWYYKPNLGSGRFGPLQPVAATPSLAALGSGRQQLLDLAGDGQLDLVELDGPTPGFFERTDNQDWESFVPFPHLPNIRWNDPNLRFVDLNGDGHADVLITEHYVFTRHPSLAEKGFGPAEQVHLPLDEEMGPRLVFADGTQSIYLADMSGDGLTDLVRIGNGAICYWPNQGYGRFGPKVTMDDAPWFDAPDQFDQRRIRIADIDGSGNNDIIYLGRDAVILYLNQSGNRWSAPHRLEQFPHTDTLSSVMAVDLLGNGTACLVWSSPLPSATGKPLRYIDLMGGQKPHLLIAVTNNLGAETHVHYAPSTKFYLEDKAAGKPWISRLPFPVHVVERIETYDRISRNRFITRRAYHHGYFDGEEREFRGFGMVEQWDTEEFATLTAGDVLPDAINLDPASHVPPVRTGTWFHTGVFLERERVSRQYEDEYYREPGLNDPEVSALLLPDTALLTELKFEEQREACRALKGMMLRQEVYADDAPPGSSEAMIQRAATPYTVVEQNFTVRALQPRAGNRHAVFFTHPREAISYHYERNPADPRIGHALTLEVDKDFGIVLKSASVGYGRRPGNSTLTGDDKAKQEKLLITYTETDITNPVDEPDAYRAPLPCEARTYELTGFAPSGGAKRFQFDDFAHSDFAALTTAEEIAYEQAPDGNSEQKRLIERVRTLYRKNDLTGAKTLGEIDSLALPFESYQLAFPPGLLGLYAEKIPLNDLHSILTGEGRYVDLDGNGCWWIPSGQVFYSSDAGDTPAQELTHAVQHFFQPHRVQDPFEEIVTVRYDPYDLLVLETEDPLHNKVTAGERDEAGNITGRNDYRVLQPKAVTGPNGNRSEVAFDALGLVVGTAVKGKIGEDKGDSLANFEPDVDETLGLDHLKHPLDDPHVILQDATTRLVYDLYAYQRTQGEPGPQPAVVYTLARETHAAELEPGEQTRVQHSFSYADGFGREIQKKIQAEPGPLEEGGAVVSPRWVGSGWTIFNNKGKPVRQYEPFFDNTHGFRFGKTVGVSPVMFYDPVERVVATLHPNRTYEKVIFDPWRQETWDVNDAVLRADPRDDPDVGDYFRRLPQAEYKPTWHEERKTGQLGLAEQSAATKTALHAGTPAVAYLDTLGRVFLTVAHNKFKYSDTAPTDPPIEEFHRSRVVLDIEGNQREVIDAMDRVVMRYDYDMLGNRMDQASMEAGERWILSDVAGNPIRAWDSRGHRFRTEYDPLRRPLRSFVAGAEPADPNQEFMTERLVYGEQHPEGELRNLRGALFLHLDPAGVVTNEWNDFKGNSLSSSRRLAREYKRTMDWSTVDASLPADSAAKLDLAALEAALAPVLETDTFARRTTYDALDRPMALTMPDDSVIRPIYNEANLLEQVGVNLRGAATATPFVANIDYDAKGQRQLIEYGNGVRTEYEYDPLTFRLRQLQTLRGSERLQDLGYTYDPAGNITHIRDDAQSTIFFNNAVVKAHADYRYDAIYRLIEASGREHSGKVGAPQTTWNDEFRIHLPHPHDGQAMRSYTEEYEYDPVGNILQLIHHAANGNWRRAYDYNEASLLESGKSSNRLSKTVVHPNGSQPIVEPYTHDAHGNMTIMPHLPLMQWDYMDRLGASSRQVIGSGIPETTYYVYDAAGQRVRKVTERAGSAGISPVRKNERIYLGGFEVYREYDGSGAPALQRDSLHVMDDQSRIALVETRVQGTDGSPPQLVRYQLDNHLGSAVLEIDHQAQIISYEEYYPYGSTSYQAGPNISEVSVKRYRYTGEERDEETGLEYHRARYCASWLGRWASADPIGTSDGLNLYTYTRDNPVRLIDSLGTQSSHPLSDAQRERVMQLVAHSTASHYAEVSEQNRAQLTEDLKEVNKPGLAVLRRREEAFRKELHALEQTGPGEKPAAFSNSNWEQSVVQELRRSESPGYKASFYAHIGLGQAVPPERTFWNRGGTTTISGALTLAGGAFVLGSNPVGWGALLLGGFAVAGGTFGVGAGSVQLITSYSGSTTLEQDLTAGEAFSVTADMGGHPFGLAGGLIGMTLDRGDEIGPAAAIGNLTGSAFGLLPGALRNRELLKPRIWGTRETFENEKALWTVSQSGKLSNPKQGAISSWVGNNAERYRLHLGITRLGVSGYTKGQRYLGNQGTSAPTAEPNYGYLPLVSGSF